ncbi:TPA: hypothetical protein U1C23_001893 [Streptococcus suis]|uniref:hypothetical protein n=1 Tax=Streptococcus suis TaxID=1307 RepID=UPI001ABEA97E|nr:hypothetical protein [Streptococcus suis]MBO4110272.1 hypothetical protein [Streptococcus suis]MDG3135092.1 hypothetical protein [Streptococcus suis]HEM3615019.1 hypothetical protein [Streptococcus suis]HEM3641759.1 hypothetical protein [Streptococcus suis]HEM3667073.1 hypothetical protein [Streptococcus suis]
MKLKDILELGTYGYNPDRMVENFDIEKFDKPQPLLNLPTANSYGSEYHLQIASIHLL